MAGELHENPDLDERDPEWLGVLGGVREGFGPIGGRLVGHPFLRSTVLATWATLLTRGAFPAPESGRAEDVPRYSGWCLGRALFAPLDALDVWPGDLSENEFLEAMGSVCQALRQLPPHAPSTPEKDDEDA